MTLSRREITDLLARHGIRPSRALGQNFVVDPNTVRRVARLAGVGVGDRVVEIGAGLGSLTLALAETGASVTAVEIDRYVLPALREIVEPVGVRVVEADALRLDWDDVLGSPAGGGAVGDADADAGAGTGGVAGPDAGVDAVVRPGGAAATGGAGPGGGGWVLVANLPYKIATPLVADLLDGVPAISRMLVMVQREVGERLAASVGDDAYGAVSVKVAYWARASVVGRVPATVFLPAPKVESALVRIDRREAPAVDPGVVSAERLFSVVRAGFAHRRKMLRGALAGVVDPEAFAAAGVSPQARAEELDVEAWGRLAAWPAPAPNTDGET